MKVIKELQSQAQPKQKW